MHATDVSTSILNSLPQIVHDVRADAIFIYVDALKNNYDELLEKFQDRVIYVTKTELPSSFVLSAGQRLVRVPNVPLTRMGQVKNAIYLALSRSLIKSDDTFIFLTGVAGSGDLDTLFISRVDREFTSMLNRYTSLPTNVNHETFDAVLNIAAELGKEGREGKPVGALFVIGDTEKVLSLSKQLILNPFKGYDSSERNVTDPNLEETIKELATLDGAFIIHGNGMVETCGAMLKVASQNECKLPQGLGSRHHSAAAITALTNSVAIAVSESTGTVSIFQGGSMITELEKPRSLKTTLRYFDALEK